MPKFQKILNLNFQKSFNEKNWNATIVLEHLPVVYIWDGGIHHRVRTSVHPPPGVLRIVHGATEESFDDLKQDK